MSRIDEALRRQDREGMPAAVPGQSAFKPAWPAAGRDRADHAHGSHAVPHSSPVGFSDKWGARLVNSPDADPGLIEQFRRLAGTLHKARRLNGLRSVMVTSATSGDGKTLTAVNLALVLSASFNSEVLLIDADLRRPSIPSVVDFSHDAGLSEALSAKSEQKLALVRIAPRLTLIPAGQPLSNSIGAVTSPRMQRIIEEATERYDWVILDAPPVGLTTDARLLAEFVGGTLFVVRARQTQHRMVSEAIAALGREQILGVVLNGIEQSGDEPQYYDPRIQGQRP
jgi:capsular exopolysaccharide synthesis family protein